MVNIECTLIQNIKDKIKRLSLQGVSDPIGLRQILSIIVISDLIEWTESLNDASEVEAFLVKLRNDLLMCYSKNLKLCNDYNSQDMRAFTSTNISESIPMWDRVWDNNGNRVDPDGLIVPGEPEEGTGLIFAGIGDFING